MKREIHNLVQGSPEWHAYRAIPKQFNASDAPAMLGESPYKSRDELLREMATGLRPDVDARTQELFDAGHRYEQQDRPLAEEVIGQELFPATVSVEFDGLRLSASLDGWTMDEEIIYEHKTLNKAIRAAGASGEIPLVYRIQLEQQLICSGAIKGLFRGSLGTDSSEQPVTLWYESDTALRDRIISGWKQFSIDLDSYAQTEPEAPKPIAEPVMSLPEIIYDLTFDKGISITSNLAEFKSKAMELVEKSKIPLTTDQDFENAKTRIKSYTTAESNIDSLVARVMGEMGDADTFVKDLNSIKEFIKKARTTEKNQIDTRNTSLKAELVLTAKNALASHVQLIDAKLSPIKYPYAMPDFSLVIKGKSSFDNMRSDLNTAIANEKIECDRLTAILEKNIAIINTIGEKHLFLFADKQQLVVKDSEALEAICKQRIADHDAAEKKRIDDAAEVLANEKIRKQKEADDAAQAVLDKQESDRVAAEEFNQQQAAKQAEPEAPAQEPVTIEPKIVYGGGGSGGGAISKPQQSTFLEPLAAKALTTLEQVQRDFETVNGLAPALAAIITKSIFDGQHKCLQIKNA